LRRVAIGITVAAMTKPTLFAVLFFACLPTRAAAQVINPDRTVNPETLIEVRNVDPRDTANQDPALLLAQALVAEAGWTIQADHVAIPYVIRRRSTLPAFRNAPHPQNEVLLNYVSAFKCYDRPCDDERKARMRSLTWPVLEARAPAIAKLAREWTDGTLPTDPCPSAWQWGSHEDGRDSPLPIVSCGTTSNLFLGRPPPRRTPAAEAPSNGATPVSARLARGRSGRN
jgi:hypothetical protein